MTAKATRLDIRTTMAAKAVLANAASCLGTTVSAFILSSAMEKAREILKQMQTIHLRAEEHERFLLALDHPPQPNEKLKKLFKKHRKHP